MVNDMPTPEFVHLHLHSEYSLLDGACRVNKLSKVIESLGMNAVAITDHGNMFAAFTFADCFAKSNVRPILGCEIYVAPPNMSHKTRAKDEYNRSYYHLVLLAESFEGYINLCQISSIGYIEGFYNKPRVDYETLAKHSKGLICLSACLAGIVPKAIVYDDLQRARELADLHIQIFGKENYFFEIENHSIPDEIKVIRNLTQLSKEMGIPLVATNDAHYLKKEDATFHDIMLCIQTGQLRNEENRKLKFYNDSFYVKSPLEMAEAFPEHPEALAQTVAIAERCQGRIKLSKDYKNEGIALMPAYKPEDGSTDKEYLRKLTHDGLIERYGEITEEVRSRAEFELRTIEGMGFVSYFLVVWDFINYAKSNCIPVGPGRGSVAGSIVAYALKITDVNPLQHSLFFERFLNPERVSMPDIDIDFCFENRWRIIEYVKRKYGTKNVGQIITFGTLKAKNAIADVGRVLGVPLAEVKRIKSLIPTDAAPDKENGLTSIQAVIAQSRNSASSETQELSRLFDTDAEIRELLQFASDVEGMPRNTGTHAAGVVISAVPLGDVIPLYKPSDRDDIAVQYTMTQVERIGLLKMDFLGLQNLTIIENTLKSIKRLMGIDVKWENISLNDPDTYEMLREGKTFGVFQLESDGMTKLVVDLAPTEFSELVALLALYRPGPLGSNMHTNFVACKHGQQEVTYDHPKLEPILKETHGMILYQEQVMQIVQALAGFSLGKADELRRAMGKKKHEGILVLKEEFITGCKTLSDIDRDLANSIYEKIERFAFYGFNKSHSAAYSIISFRTAYLKKHYTIHYLAALMTNAIGQKLEVMSTYFAEAKNYGIKMLPPSVNSSNMNFTVDGKSIRFGLAAIKNVGRSAVENIIEARDKGGMFKSFEDFCFRVDLSAVNSASVEALIKVGAFDLIHQNRAQLLAMSQMVISDVKSRLQDRAQGQDSLFDVGMSSEEPIVETSIPDWSIQKKLAYENEYLGFFVSGNPFGYSFMLADALCDNNFDSYLHSDASSMITIGGMITNLRVRTTKSSTQMALFSLKDRDDNVIPVTVFSEAYEKYRPILLEDTFISLTGRIQDSEKWGRQLITDKILLLKKLGAEKINAISLEISEIKPFMEKIEELETLLRKYPGPNTVEYLIHDATGMLRVVIKNKFEVDVKENLINELGELDYIDRLSLNVK